MQTSAFTFQSSDDDRPIPMLEMYIISTCTSRPMLFSYPGGNQDDEKDKKAG